MPTYMDPYMSKIPCRIINGKRAIICDCCNQPVYCLGTVDNLYHSYDFYICDNCNIGYKAELFTAFNTDYYLSIEKTNVNDINTIIEVRTRINKFKKAKRIPVWINQPEDLEDLKVH